MRHEDMAVEMIDCGEVVLEVENHDKPVVISRFEAVKFRGNLEFAVLDRVTDEIISDGFSSLKEARAMANAMQSGLGFGGLYRNATSGSLGSGQ